MRKIRLPDSSTVFYWEGIHDQVSWAFELALNVFTNAWSYIKESIMHNPTKFDVQF